MKFPRVGTLIIVAGVIVASFTISFMVGKRLITGPPKLSSILSELPPPAAVEVYEESTPTPIPTSTPTLPPPTKVSWSGPAYTVAVGAYQYSKNAWSERSRFRKMGYSAVVQKRGKYYRVQIGKYSSLAQAKRLAAQLNKKGIAGYATKF